MTDAAAFFHMNALVTGAAGFIGSHLCEALLASGDFVRGVDSFTPFYDRGVKEQNLATAQSHVRFEFVRTNLVDDSLHEILDGVDVVYHLAGQPGVRSSWGAEFGEYVRLNIVSTQRLLEHCRKRDIMKLVFASSSSVYGNAETLPTGEDVLPRPVSPYGVTKLAAEHLAELYWTVHGVPTVSLRLFSVYGPRQRPDMAFTRLIRAALTRQEFKLLGDGKQTRDFTFVADAVEGFQKAARASWEGVANIGGGAQTSMNEVIRIVESLCGEVMIQRLSAQPGDARHTAADITRAREAFGYGPSTSLKKGLSTMVDWERARLDRAT